MAETLPALLPTGAAWRRGGAMRSASFSIGNTLTGLGSTAFRRTLPGVTRRERCGRSAISICPTSTAWSRRAALGETAKLRYVTLLNVFMGAISKNGLIVLTATVGTAFVALINLAAQKVPGPARPTPAR